MSHYEERILELFVLKSPDLADRQAEIQQHLDLCPSCHSRVEEIMAYYADLRTELDSVHRNQESPRQLPVKAGSRTLPSYFERIGKLRQAPPQQIAFRLWDILRMNPYRTAGAGAIIAVALIALLWLRPTLFGNTNPAYYKLDQQKGFVRLFNARDEELWHLSVPIETLTDVSMFPLFSKVADLDGNGVNKLIATHPVYYDGKLLPWELKIFGSTGSLQTAVEFDKLLSFRGRDYSGIYQPKTIEIIGQEKGTRRDILCVVGNGRSPTMVARLDAKGQKLGEYWHFGDLVRMKRGVLEGGREALFVVGTLDIEEIESQETLSSASLIVLDPSKLSGESESGVTRGFGYSTTPAEIAYINIPPNGIDSALGVQRLSALFSSGESKDISISVQSDGPNGRWGLTYLFDARFNVTEVKADDGIFHAVRASNASGKKSTMLPDSTYLKSLRSRVRYWTGTSWTTKPSFIHSP